MKCSAPRSDLSALFITREMLIREPDMELFDETKRRSVSGCCIFCGADLVPFDTTICYSHMKNCRILAWGASKMS